MGEVQQRPLGGNINMALNVVGVRRLWRSLLYEVEKLKYAFTSDLHPATALVLPLPQQHQPSLEDSDPPEKTFDNGFLWAWHRRSLERRLMRKLGRTRIIRPKKNILTCDVCGHFYEAHTVCGNCWKKVKQETEAMQEAIQNELQLNPVEKEVIVLYSDDKSNEKHEGKTVVKLAKERPPWFSKNLLTKANL